MWDSWFATIWKTKRSTDYLENFKRNCQLILMNRVTKKLFETQTLSSFDSTVFGIQFLKVCANQCDQSTKRTCFSIILILLVIHFKVFFVRFLIQNTLARLKSILLVIRLLSKTLSSIFSVKLSIRNEKFFQTFNILLGN